MREDYALMGFAIITALALVALIGVVIGQVLTVGKIHDTCKKEGKYTHGSVLFKGNYITIECGGTK